MRGRPSCLLQSADSHVLITYRYSLIPYTLERRQLYQKIPKSFLAVTPPHTVRYTSSKDHSVETEHKQRIAWYTNQNKNLAIANRSRVSCAHNTLRASIGINITPWPWNQGHWKRNHWIDHTRLNSSRFDVEYYCDLEMWMKSLKVIESGNILKLGCGFLFAFHSNYYNIYNIYYLYSNYGRICSSLWDIQCQRMAWPWKPG